jgi:excisionase family DNA binding protein
VSTANGTAQLTLALSDEALELIAHRVADLLADRDGGEPAGYLDVVGAADFLACPLSRIYALVSAKRIPHHRDGSRLLFDRAELRDYVHRGGARRP